MILDFDEEEIGVRIGAPFNPADPNSSEFFELLNLLRDGDINPLPAGMILRTRGERRGDGSWLVVVEKHAATARERRIDLAIFARAIAELRRRGHTINTRAKPDRQSLAPDPAEVAADPLEQARAMRQGNAAS